MSFADVLFYCGRQSEFVENFDRLYGSNLSRRGSGLDLMIDDSTGRTMADAQAFADFVREYVYEPVYGRDTEGRRPPP